MALLWIESFGGVSTSTLSEKYLTAGSPTVVTGPLARQTTTALLCDASGESISHMLEVDANVLIIGFAFQTSSLVSANRIIEFTSPNDIVQVSVEIQTDGSLDVLTGTSGVIGSTAISTIVVDTWYYIEFSATIGNTGAFELRIDGSNEASNGSADTRDDGANDQVRQCTIGSLNSAPNNYFTDHYILDTAGVAPQNTFIGDCHVHHRKPDVDGTTNDWAAQAAGTNFSEVNQDAPDGDTTYNSSNTIGNIDLFGMEDIDTNVNSIIGVQTNINVRKIDGPVRTIEDVIRSGGTNYLGVGTDDSMTLQTTYNNKHTIHEHDPDTATEWIESGINSAEFGYRLES